MLLAAVTVLGGGGDTAHAAPQCARELVTIDLDSVKQGSGSGTHNGTGYSFTYSWTTDGTTFSVSATMDPTSEVFVDVNLLINDGDGGFIDAPVSIPTPVSSFSADLAAELVLSTAFYQELQFSIGTCGGPAPTTTVGQQTPTTVPSVGVGGDLPSTGSRSGAPMQLAVVLLIAGACVVLLARRRPIA